VPKILAIDDSLTIRKLVDMILRGAGHEVLLAETGAKGLALAVEEKPDLILLDYVLPDARSPDICRQLLENPSTAGIPILMISTNGAAIRQLYADSRNVRDYLTKPFPPKVLQSVVEHLLTQRPKADAEEPSEIPDLPVEGPAEQTPSTKALIGVLAPRPGTVASNSPTRFGPGAASAMASDGHALLRALLNARFRNIAKMIPELESRRGKLPAETFYLPFLLRNELVAEIVAEVSRNQISAEHAAPLIAGTHEWMGIDSTFFHLARTAATGIFSFKLASETIDVTLSQGRVLMVGSNNPRAYCVGAVYNFRGVPAPAIANAVAAQQRDGTPFFITLCRLGILRDPAMVNAFLRGQGVRAVHRAMTTPGARYVFVPREALPEHARQFTLDLDVRQFVLEVLRRVDDWLEIESTTGSVETVLVADPAAQLLSAQLMFTNEESAVLGSANGQRSLQDIATVTGLDLFGTCAAVYRLLKLHLLRVGSGATPAPSQTDPSVEEFLQETTPTNWESTVQSEEHAPSS
jgi:CheY-like chemotaxis protein